MPTVSTTCDAKLTLRHDIPDSGQPLDHRVVAELADVRFFRSVFEVDLPVAPGDYEFDAAVSRSGRNADTIQRLLSGTTTKAQGVYDRDPS